jgi:hypothetical protein
MSGSEVPPPPSAALLARLSALQPVRTRHPRAEAVGVAAASLAALVGLLALFGPRGDLASPLVLVGAAICGAAFVAELWWALVPPRGQVLPVRPAAGTRAALTWAVMVAALLLAAHNWAPDPRFVPSARACLLLGTTTAVVPALLCVALLRRAVDVAGWRLGVLVGGASGALGALCLALHCANGHVAHVVIAHGGAAALPILVLALVTRR